MTQKQKHILDAALELFAKEGYYGTSTSKVAKKAGVSEGLIFRHFKNKEGLVKTILEQGELRINELLIPIINEEDPKQIIKKTLELPFNVKESEFVLWKIQFKLKWELEKDNIENMKPLQQILTLAFAKLRYKHPELEAKFLIICLEGVFAATITHEMKNEQTFKAFLLKKYHLVSI